MARIEGKTGKLTEKDVLEKSSARPDLTWTIFFFRNPRDRGRKKFLIFDGEHTLQRTIMGQEARKLEEILMPRRPNVPGEVVRAFRPLLAEVFSAEFDLDEVGEMYKQKLIDGQPRVYKNEPVEDVYRRMWAGKVIRGGFTAEDVADRIIKAEDRVGIAVAWGDISRQEIDQKVKNLADAIKRFNPVYER